MSKTSKIKERPMLFSAPMVRALLDGRKTQTRRAVKSRFEIDYLPLDFDGPIWPHNSTYSDAFEEQPMSCPHGQPGDRLWVREAWSHDAENLERCRASHEDAMGGSYGPYYRATEFAPDTLRWYPSIYMPRWASRITLEIISVRVERLQDISEPDAMAEGVCAGDWEYDNGEGTESARESYQRLWESINGPGSWDANPWVWVIEFKAVK